MKGGIFEFLEEGNHARTPTGCADGAFGYVGQQVFGGLFQAELGEDQALLIVFTHRHEISRQGIQ